MVQEIANRGKTRQVDAVKSSKNVVEIWGFYCCGILTQIIISLFFKSLYLLNYNKTKFKIYNLSSILNHLISQYIWKVNRPL